MLQKLSIYNYAIIDELTIQFSDGLNIITGETGAGKSILMGALNLVLGQRADTGVLREKTSKCIVEGVFMPGKHAGAAAFFLANDLDESNEIILRREIAPNGKTRSFINDTPVTLSQLRELATMLVDLHQQFDTLELGEKDFQRQVVDALANNQSLLQQIATEFDQYKQTNHLLEEKRQMQAQANRELDYNQFVFEELDALSLEPGQLEELDAEIRILENAEQIKQQLAMVYETLKDGETPVLQLLKSLANRLQHVSAVQPAVEALQQRILSAQVELADIADELEQVDDGIRYDAARIQEINDKLSAGYKLYKKHGVNSTAELIDIRENLKGKLEQVMDLDNELRKLEARSAELLAAATITAGKISTNRKKVLKGLVDKTNELLAQVGMPNARLQVTLTDTSLNMHGMDEVSFLFDANNSKRFEPLHKVASGGELSRLMLSIKSLVARKLQLPTLIFDEIDTGISGEAAKQVGRIMKELSAAHQVISITHQPQIAARATAHFFVYKEIVGDRIATSIRKLDNDERITAIARMLSGEKPTAAALENAREMVGN